MFRWSNPDEEYPANLNMNTVKAWAKDNMKELFEAKGKGIVFFVPKGKSRWLKMDKKAVGLENMEIREWDRNRIWLTRFPEKLNP